MATDQIEPIWKKEDVENGLTCAFENNSEVMLLDVLKKNSFLFYELFSRKNGVQPIFHEVSFGGDLRCDFAWLNDNSDGPEWVLVEIEKPKQDLFTKAGDPTAKLNHAIEQVKSWRRYFNQNDAEKRRIFGAVAKFRYIIVIGDYNVWQTESAAKWRIDHNKSTEIEIRSSDIFFRALDIHKEAPEKLWSFENYPKTFKYSELKYYWKNNEYIQFWIKILN